MLINSDANQFKCKNQIKSEEVQLIVPWVLKHRRWMEKATDTIKEYHGAPESKIKYNIQYNTKDAVERGDTSSKINIHSKQITNFSNSILSNLNIQWGN